MKKLRLAGILIAFAIVLSSVFGAPSVQAAAPRTHFSEALAYLPAAASKMEFTDWARLKKIEGVATMNSANTAIEQRSDWLRKATLNTQAPFTGMAVPTMLRHFDVWGWDSTDLIWEALILSKDEPGIAVLRFRDDYDFESLYARYRNYAFTESAIDSNTMMFTATLDVKAGWASLGEFALKNSVFLKKQRVLIASSGMKMLNRSRASAKSATALPASAQRISRTLDQPIAAFFIPAPNGCDATASLAKSIARLSASRQAAIKSALGLVAQASRYDAFAVSYDYAAKRPVGTIAMDYANPAAAAADLAARAKAASEGISLVAAKPVSESLFTLENARAQGNTQVFTVRPMNDQPRRLRQMVLNQDMIFAVCGA